MAPNPQQPFHFHPLQVTLQMTRQVRVGHHPAAMVCQLIKAAGTAAGMGDAFPTRLLPDPVEVGRMTLDQGRRFTFGLWLMDRSADDCRQRWGRVLEALRRIGRPRDARGTGDAEATGLPPKPPQKGNRPQPTWRDCGLRGNFTVAAVRSLVAPECDQPLPLPDEWIERQVAAAEAAKSLTLRWLSPLCASLPRRMGKKPGRYGDTRAGFFDTQRFPVADLANRLVRRLRGEFHADVPEMEVAAGDLVCLDPPGLAALHWIKWNYGPPQHPKSLYGVIGRIVVQVRRPELIRPLVLGQYACVGEKTSFGLGRYAIEETQPALPSGAPRYLRPARSEGLVALAMGHPVVQREAERLNVPAGQAGKLAGQIVGGNYRPRPVIRFLLPGDRPRLLAVPSRVERVLQRAVHELLAPVLDRFLSDSSLAYRRGLGRTTAAQRIHKAFQQGWRWALRADFHRFFDSVDHALLRAKLEAYVQDDAMVDLLMQWVAAGAPQPGRGLPTGAVISPLLANLFLEQFDQQVHEDGGLLVRYADDFVLLFRDPAKGRQILERAGELAERLKLHLNQEKTRLLDLNDTPFDFLGYRFFAEKGWHYHGDGLTEVQDLGWHEAPRGKPVSLHQRLPGEGAVESSRSGIWIVGPEIDWVGIDGPDVVCRSRPRGTEDRFQRRRVSELVVLGPATLDHSLFRHRNADALNLFLADDAGRWISTVTDEPPLELPGLVRAQVALSADPDRRLALGRRLVVAKLTNHATVAAAYPARGRSGQLGEKLRRLAEQAGRAASESELLGIEGAGAAAWYGELRHRIDRRFSFERREHPAAGDPVNVMLNLAHTILHRVICLCLIREGFAPSIGILHHDGERHATLASDLQEPFRHLAERVVIEATGVVSPGEFHAAGSGPFLLRMEAGTYRTLVAAVFRTLSTECVAAGQQAARSYRRQMATMCRSLHRHLLNPEAHFKVFQHIG